ncbi:MAG TPA: FtsQ-type POTRA domain-containing protein [Acidimicrobiales bacterium]|nr:FtsQ-type POTRA domain-containing protein [Acidimicrobiales bacterium]
MSESREVGRTPIDPRVRERRQEVARAAGRRRLRIVTRLLIASVVLAGTVALTQSPLLDVDRVQVNGVEQTSTRDVTRAAGLDRGRHPMLTLDRRRIATRVESLPWVASATVERSWPATVVVDVTERAAVATVPTKDGVALLDPDGRILALRSGAPSGVVAIAVQARPRTPGATVEPAVLKALDVVLALPQRLAREVRAVPVTGRGSALVVDLALTSGVTVRLGAPLMVSEKLRAALAVLDAEKPPTGSIVDVRVPRSPTLKRPGPTTTRQPS